MMFLGAAKYSLEMHVFRMLFSHLFLYRFSSHDNALLGCACGPWSIGDVEWGLTQSKATRSDGCCRRKNEKKVGVKRVEILSHGHVVMFTMQTQVWICKGVRVWNPQGLLAQYRAAAFPRPSNASWCYQIITSDLEINKPRCPLPPPANSLYVSRYSKNHHQNIDHHHHHHHHQKILSNSLVVAGVGWNSRP